MLLRANPSLTTFIDEMPNLEAAARGMIASTNKYPWFPDLLLVSVQTLLQSVKQLASGLSHMKVEVRNLKEVRAVSEEDCFIQVMEASGPLL